MPLVRERLADILIRKRSFVHIDEYLTRHPDFIKSLRARPVGMHPDFHGQGEGDQRQEGGRQMLEPLILARWLGKDFDPQRILEIKQQEFGGKKGVKKKAKR